MEVGQIEPDQVMAQQEVCSISQIIQSCQSRGKSACFAGKSHKLTGIRPYSGEFVDSTVFDTDLQVYREASSQGEAATVKRQSMLSFLGLD